MEEALCWSSQHKSCKGQWCVNNRSELSFNTRAHTTHDTAARQDNRRYMIAVANTPAAARASVTHDHNGGSSCAFLAAPALSYVRALCLFTNSGQSKLSHCVSQLRVVLSLRGHSLCIVPTERSHELAWRSRDKQIEADSLSARCVLLRLCYACVSDLEPRRLAVCHHPVLAPRALGHRTAVLHIFTKAVQDRSLSSKPLSERIEPRGLLHL